MKNDEFIFEKAIIRLDEIANILEKNEITLDESLNLFEEGVRLGKFCDSKLKDVEQKIIILKSLDFDETDIAVKNGNNENQLDNQIDNIDNEDNQNSDNKKNKIVKKNKNVDEDKGLF